LMRPDPNDSPVRWAEDRAWVERAGCAAVFTAHPTCALPVPVARALVEAASGRPTPTTGSHRPPPITLPEEFAQAADAIAHGRDAIDQFNAVLLSVARGGWPDRWTELAPRPVILSSWVGYDTDGRPPRHRLVGHAAAAAEDEAPQAGTTTFTCHNTARHDRSVATHRRGTRGGQRADRPVPDCARTAAGRRLCQGAGRSARRRDDL